MTEFTIPLLSGWEPRQPASPGAVAEHLRCPADERLYVLLDAARDDAVLRLLAQEECPFEPLFQGGRKERLYGVSPFLVRCRDASRLMDWATSEGLGCVVFLHSREGLRELAAAMRRLLMVRTEQHEALLFRFYDPRVLRVYLPTCDGREQGLIFAGVERYLLQATEGDALLSFDAPAERDRQARLEGRLLIRPPQMAAFDRLAREGVMDQLCDHLQRHLPDRCAELGQRETRRLVDLGMDRAAAHGLTMEQDVSSYINLMFVLGRDFDSDPALAWAGKILRDPQVEDPSDRMVLLYEEAAERLEQRPRGAGSEELRP